MKGWKTWMAAAALFILSVVDMANGDTWAAVEKITGAIALVGIGHKLDRASVNG